MTAEKKTGKVQLAYPCLWLYKIIGEDQVSMHRAIAETVRDPSCSVSCGNSSNNGKYHSLNIEVDVQSEEHRNAIYSALKAHPAVKMVL